MLAITKNAAKIVSTIIEKQIHSVDGGIRISPTNGGFNIAMVHAGQPGDTVIKSRKAKVYLEQTASLILDDKILDAMVAKDGDVEFQLAMQH